MTFRAWYKLVLSGNGGSALLMLSVNWGESFALRLPVMGLEDWVSTGVPKRQSDRDPNRCEASCRACGGITWPGLTFPSAASALFAVSAGRVAAADALAGK